MPVAEHLSGGWDCLGWSPRLHRGSQKSSNLLSSTKFNADVVQLEEYMLAKHEVVGSNPIIRSRILIMNPIVIDQLVPKSYQEELASVIGGVYFPWYWAPKQNGMPGDTAAAYDYQMVHNFVAQGRSNSDYVGLISPILYFLEEKTGIVAKGIVRAKANLLTSAKLSDEELDHFYHIDDIDPNLISMLYYVEDSDGDTVIGDLRVEPKAGRAVVFNSNTRHRPSHPSVHERRIVINFILEV